jgi:diaminopimelate decarboxylase
VDFFEYKNGELFAEGVPIQRIAEEVGTPTYVYSLATLRRHYRVFDQVFLQLPHLICFSVKANSNLAVLRVFAKEGGGFDIVSVGELYRVVTRRERIPKKLSSPAWVRKERRSSAPLMWGF